MGGFNQSSVNANGGVAWAKQVADSMETSALDDQIAHYQKAATQLAKVQETLQNVKNNLAASWTGDAADQAQASFQSSIDQAVTAHDTIQAVVPPLQSAKAAQTEFVSTMKGIQSEKSVPSNSITDEASHFFFGSQLPSQAAESHNTTVRTQTADALNKLSSSYEQSAGDMHLAVSGGGGGGGGGGGTAPIVGGGGSGDGLASGYSEKVGGGATYKAGYVPTPDGPGTGGTIGTGSPNGPGPGNPDHIAGPVGAPIEGEPFPVEPEPEPAPIGGGAELITDEPGGGKGSKTMVGDSLEEENPRYSSKSGVFDENGFSDGELTGRGSGSKVRSTIGMDEEEESGGSRGGVFGEEEAENPQSMSGAGGGRGRGGMGGESEEELSSKYSRGRYFDGELEEGERSSLSPVRSAFENATDGEGNKVDMMGGRRSGNPGEDEEEERGKRPRYLTEDEFWGGAQRVVPPVIQ